MRLYDHGTRITLDWHDLLDFAEHWPCSGIRTGDRMSVSIDGRTGDLIDYTYNGRCPAPARVDGSALHALTEDANDFAARRLNRPELARPAGWRAAGGAA